MFDSDSTSNLSPKPEKISQPPRLLEESQKELPITCTTTCGMEDISLQTDGKLTNVSQASRARQLLGMKGADVKETSVWKIRLQLLKPITWIGPMWAVICGAVSSSNFTWTLENCLVVISCMLLSGPLMTGYAQTINDFHDRDLDAINEPYRPIPSGAISIPQVVAQIWVTLVAGVAVSVGLDLWVGHSFPVMVALTLFGTFVAYIYGAPGLKLKRNGWLSNYALGASYIALPWWAGYALFGTLTPTIVLLTSFYSLAGWGIAVVNDFKSIEGDAHFGMKSLPVMFGVQRSAWIAAAVIDTAQLGTVLYLVYIGQILYSAILGMLIIPQIVLQRIYLLNDPLKNDVKYQASAQPFLVLGMLMVALALRKAGI